MNLLNIFQVILLSSLVGSIIVLIILVIKGILRNKLNSTFHYYIWLILIIKLVIPFGPETSLNLSNLHKSFYKQNIINENTEINSLNLPENIESTNDTSINSSNTSRESVMNNAANLSIKNKVNIKKIFSLIWGLGALLLILISVLSHRRLKEIIRTSIKNTNIHHNEILNNCIKTMNLKTKVELCYSLKINSPSLCGFIKPKILIPLSMVANVSDDEFKYILMHELIHLKNKDILINWIITLLSIIYWFNPILLYGFHKMRQDCEFSCDGRVISYLDQEENIKYGNVIIRVLELGGGSNRLMGTALMVMNKSQIRSRIIMISRYKKINTKGILLGTMVIVMLGALSIAINTSKINSHKNLAEASTLQAQTPRDTSKDIADNRSKESPSTAMTNSSSDNTQSLTPSLSDIIIYNSHPDEDYSLSGAKVTDIGALINDKLLKEGIKSSFINNEGPIEYVKAYQTSRKLITENVEDYSNKVLLDIHRNIVENTQSDEQTILFVLAKNSPYYKDNKKFVDTLLKNIKASSKVKAEIFLYDNGISYFNQDLSNNSVLVEIGNNMSSDKDIEDCVNALVSALKHIKKDSSN